MKRTVHKCCTLVGKFLSQSGMGSAILKLHYMYTRVEHTSQYTVANKSYCLLSEKQIANQDRVDCKNESYGGLGCGY